MMDQAVYELMGGARESDGAETMKTNEGADLQHSRLNMLRKQLIAPEIEHVM